MTGLPAAQPNHSLATAHAPAQVAVWPPGVPAPALVGSRAWARVIRQARCTKSSLDADMWFPVSPGAQQARQEAAAAIAICKDCPVRSQCLALSLRHWDVGQHGVWGGMVAAERASLRRQMLAHRADALGYFTGAAGLPSLPLTSPASTTGGRGKIFSPNGSGARSIHGSCYRSRSPIGAVQSSPAPAGFPPSSTLSPHPKVLPRRRSGQRRSRRSPSLGWRPRACPGRLPARRYAPPSSPRVHPEAGHRSALPGNTPLRVPPRTAARITASRKMASSVS
jgi:Transcription factor WhiB